MLDPNLVDTGDFLGYLHVIGDYTFHYTLQNWWYMPEENVTETGSWGWIFR
jgi:hypothetical protein